jgi:hypothetical protein
MSKEFGVEKNMKVVTCGASDTGGIFVYPVTVEWRVRP